MLFYGLKRLLRNYLAYAELFSKRSSLLSWEDLCCQSHKNSYISCMSVRVTDVEDKQVLSIAAQIAELKEFAARMGIHIIEVVIEKQTAKKPGRPKFNKVLERIEAGEVNVICKWMPDRLSRNSIDSGKLFTCSMHVLIDPKFPHFWFENTPQGKYMLANEFNASKTVCR